MAPTNIEIVEENGGKATDGQANGNDNGNHPPARNNSTKANKRSRWATRKMTGRSSNMKRLSIIGRKAKRLSHHSEKKRASGGTESLRQPGGEEADDDADSQSSEEVAEPRTVFFGLPLPDEEKDEEGSCPMCRTGPLKASCVSFFDVPKSQADIGHGSFGNYQEQGFDDSYYTS